MNNKNKRGYVLAAVMILILIMTITVTSAFSLIMRYMFFAKSNLEELGQSAEATYSYVGEEVDIDACI